MECFAAMMDEYLRNVPEQFHPDYLKNSISVYGNVSVWADSLFSNSIFTRRGIVKALEEDGAEQVFSDPAYIFADSFSKWYADEI